MCITDWPLNTISQTALLEQSFTEKQGSSSSLSQVFPLKAKIINSIITRKFSFTEARACWLPSAFWGNSWRMFGLQQSYRIHIILCLAWLADRKACCRKNLMVILRHFLLEIWERVGSLVFVTCFCSWYIYCKLKASGLAFSCFALGHANAFILSP